MSESSAPSPTRGHNCDYTAAFLLLRLFLALRAIFSAIEKFELNGTYSFANYYQSMSRMASGITSVSFLPLWMTKSFALPLGYVLFVLGVAILLGIKPRVTYFLMGLVYVALAFGLMVVQEGEGVAWLGVHVIMCVAALVLARHNRFAVWPDKHD